MDILDIAGIVFVCVTMNHLGLIGKIEEFMGELPILNCPKCSSFWATLVYCLWGMCHGYGDFITSLAISFFASYSALWLELLEAYLDKFYIRIYEQIYENPDNTPASDTDGSNPAGSVS